MSYSETLAKSLVGTLSFPTSPFGLYHFHPLKTQVLVGSLDEDSKGRFPPNHIINTSNVLRFVEFEGKFYAETTYSVYGLDVSREEIEGALTGKYSDIPFVVV